MSRARRRWRLTLVGAIGVAIVAATGAVAYFTSHGTGTGFASTGSLSAPTLSATPGAGTVGLSWTTVIPPTGSDPVTYYVMRDGVDAGGSCPASASPTGVTSCADSGLSAGTYQYTVTAKWHSWTATSNVQTVTLASGALDHFLVTPATGTQTAGTPFSVTVTAKDAANNTVSAYAGAIHFASNDGRAVVPGGYTFTTGAGGDNGVHAFTNGVTLKTAGTGKTVTVADGSATGTAAYTVGPGAATQIVLSGSTADLVSGSTRTFTATIEDAYGNTSDSGPDSGASVDFEQTGGAGSVSGTGASLASAGVVSKTVTGKIAGSVTIRATATLSGSGATGSNILAFTVDAGPAAQLVFGPQPAGATGGTAFTTQPVVTARDAAGNVATSYAATVSL